MIETSEYLFSRGFEHKHINWGRFCVELNIVKENVKMCCLFLNQGIYKYQILKFRFMPKRKVYENLTKIKFHKKVPNLTFLCLKPQIISSGFGST